MYSIAQASLRRRRWLMLATLMALVTAGLVAAPVGAVGTYSEVSAAVGMDFDHATGNICSPPIGTGTAWADMDGDGDVDHYVTNRGGANALFRNVGDTNSDGLPDFVDVAVSAGVDASAAASHAAVFVDFDNDGDQDLYVTNWNGNTLFRNDGDTNTDGIPDFSDATAMAGLADFGRAITSAWGDFDQDGLLDVYLAKHLECADTDTHQDRLFHNEGGGVFTEVTSYLCEGAATCPEVNGLGFTAAWVDIDNDGDSDLYLVNDNIESAYQPNRLWRNDGPEAGGNGWDFVEVSAAYGADASLNGMGLAVGDYNNDGFLDFAFSNSIPARLLENNGGVGFTDVSIASGVDEFTRDKFSWGSVFFDHDNDGDQDLYIVASEIGPGQPNVFMDNNGDGTFTDVSVASGLDDDGKARAASISDFDADGWVDVYVANYGDNNGLYRNNGGTNGWVAITVQGTDSNRDGIGARLELTSAQGTQIREINSGPTHGGGDQRVAWFGVGADSSATLVIKWPNGVEESLGDVTLGQYHHFVEPASGPSGSIEGRVFADLDGNGIEDGADTGLGGVAVAIIDAGGSTTNVTTNLAGNYVALGLDVGDASLTVTGPAGHSLTTGNDAQVVAVAEGATTVAGSVGYEPPPVGTVVGRVFQDLDGNGVEDGADTGLANVNVTINDAVGGVTVEVTDGNGDFSSDVASGDATVSYATPTGFSLTTANSSQVLTVPDGGSVSASPVGYQMVSGTPPDIRRVRGDNSITQGTTDSVEFLVNDYQSGATWEFSGNGLAVTSAALIADRRVLVTLDAAADADLGPHDVTVTNPDGLSDTFGAAVEVVAGAGAGEISGHVFTDVDGNGVEDGADTGLAGVLISATDAGSAVHDAVTDSDGNYVLTGVTPGDATVTASTPTGHALSTGNAVQTITVVDAASVAADAVGYQPVPIGDVSGRVFNDIDANGVEDGAEGGLAGVEVTVTDAVGTEHVVATSSSGDFLVAGAAPGDATVAVETPAGYTLTTGNDVQTVTIIDGLVVDAEAVGFAPPSGTPPDLIRVSRNSIMQGETKVMRVIVSGYQEGGTWTVSGTGVSITDALDLGGRVQITVVADLGASTGLRDLTLTNPDGLSDTLAAAINVLAATAGVLP